MNIPPLDSCASRHSPFPTLLRSLLAASIAPFVMADVASAAAIETDAASALEAEIAGIVEGSHVTIVHFWAPWCPNCLVEMRPEGWAAFLAANPEVTFVFVNVWHREMSSAAKLAAGGLGTQPNLVLRTHPNPIRSGPGRLEKFLDLPITWLPTTWVFREGKLRFALNYGEVRFPMLQQMVDDTREAWKH